MMLAPFFLAAGLLQPCTPADGLEAICGPVASEDLARIPGTSWLVASGLNVGAPAHLYLIDATGKRARPAFPGAAPMKMEPSFRGVCPGPPQTGAISIDGMNIRGNSPGQPTLLFAANHGDRHAIEVFRIEAGQIPALAWIGCVPMPKGTLANAVLALSDGGLLATSFHDPGDAQAWERMERGESTGGVWEWRADKGWSLLPLGPVAGANGLEISSDERTLYVSEWASRRVLAVSRESGERREFRLDFLPDNIHRAADGTLLVAGQHAAVRDIAACGAKPCPQEWSVVRLDPVRGTVEQLVSGKGSSVINYVCAALEVEGTLFMTLRGEPRIAWKHLELRSR